MTISGPVRPDSPTNACVFLSQQALIRESGDVKDIALHLESLTESLKLARKACLDELEAYFGEADPSKCIGPRNESAAISLLQQRLQSEGDSSRGDHQFTLRFVPGWLTCNS